MRIIRLSNPQKIIFLVMVFSMVFLSCVNDAYAVTVFLRPDGLGSGTNWGGGGTFENINESSRDDADFITSDRLGGNRQDFVIFSLSNGEDPIVDISHVIRYTYREDGMGSSSPRLDVTLKQGDTDLITWTETSPLPNTFTLATHEIPPNIVAQISDYNNLRLEFRAKCDGCPSGGGGANNDSVSVSWAEIQYETYTTPRDHPPPKISGIGFYKIESLQQNETTVSDVIKLANYSKYSDTTDAQNYGKYKKSGTFYEIGQKIPTFKGEINERIQTQVKLDGVFASTRIEHLSLISIDVGYDLRSPNFEIIADKGKRTITIDPNKILKDVKSTYSLEDGSLWINLDIVFQKPLEKSDIILQAWDELRRPTYTEIFDVWEIRDPLAMSVPNIQKFDRVKVAILQKPSPEDCKTNKPCYDPPEITIRNGGTIVWKNQDTIIHTVVSGTPENGPDGKFNFAITPQQSQERLFPFAGTYTYYCSLHPWYTGTIVVSKNPDIAIRNHQYVDFEVVTSGGATITNEQAVTLEDHKMDFLLSGHIPNTKKRIPVEIFIKRPDGSSLEYSVKTAKDGHYSMLIKMTKWQSGKFEVISSQNGIKLGHVNFTTTDKKQTLLN